MNKGKELLNSFRKEADFINETYGLGDEDHDTALERGHIYDLMKRYKIKTLEDVKEIIEEKLMEAKRNKGGGLRQFAPTETEMIYDTSINMKIAVCESLKYDIEKLKL